MPDIVTNGVKIHYERTGGNKPRLILLHGITDSGQCWPRVVGALQKDHDVIMLDARSHGRSDAPQSGYTYDNMAKDVAGVIEALGLRKPAIVGHSMGAMTAAVTGALYPTVPGCLVLEDPPWRAVQAPQAERDTQAQDWRNLIMSRKAMTLEQTIEESYQRSPGSKLWDKVEFAPWFEAKQRVSPNIVAITVAVPPPWQDFIPRIACPTLLVTSDPERGGIVTPEVARQVAALNANVQVVNIANAGHNIRRENFAAYMSAVTTFLNSVAH